MKSTGIKKIIIILMCITILCLAGIGIMTIKNGDSDVPASISENTSEPPSTARPIIKDFVVLNNIDTQAGISKYFTYGTTLCMEGSFNDADAESISDISIILRQAYTEPDGSIVSEDLYEFDAYYTINADEILFSSYEDINNGISLENLSDGEYCMLLKTAYIDGKIKYISFKSNTIAKDICYYTITKNGINQRIDIGFEDFSEISYLSFYVSKAPLPEDVYDIVIDAGHGGNDAGAVNGSYHEADITLDYALDLKTALETAGFKVKLTRDGTESPNEKMAYTMYDENGRVNVAGASNAKYCLSIHLNSNAEYVSRGGLQIYTSCRADRSFAKLLATNISESSGCILSNMKAFKLEDGIYTRSFSQGDVNSSISEAKAGGYEPYAVTTDTDYYYMIRELGGIATNAYVDGRKSPYGTNLYRDSIQGIESYILELGFISIDEDLEHILNNKAGYIKGIVSSFIQRRDTLCESRSD